MCVWGWDATAAGARAAQRGAPSPALCRYGSAGESRCWQLSAQRLHPCAWRPLLPFRPAAAPPPPPPLLCPATAQTCTPYTQRPTPAAGPFRPACRRVAWERGSLTPELLAGMDHPITGGCQQLLGFLGSLPCPALLPAPSARPTSSHHSSPTAPLCVYQPHLVAPPLNAPPPRLWQATRCTCPTSSTPSSTTCGSSRPRTRVGGWGWATFSTPVTVTLCWLRCAAHACMALCVPRVLTRTCTRARSDLWTVRLVAPTWALQSGVIGWFELVRTLTDPSVHRFMVQSCAGATLVTRTPAPWPRASHRSSSLSVL